MIRRLLVVIFLFALALSTVPPQATAGEAQGGCHAAMTGKSSHKTSKPATAAEDHLCIGCAAVPRLPEAPAPLALAASLPKPHRLTERLGVELRPTPRPPRPLD